MAKEIGMPVCYLCSSELSVEELLSRAAHLSKGGDFVQLICYSKELLPRILPSYLNAVVRQRDNIMRSDSVEKEMLLLMAGEMNVSKAIRSCGIRDNGNFILFSTSEKLAEQMISAADVKSAKRVKLELDYDAAQEVAITPIRKD
ncbi:MAG: hypothetical protein KGH59_00755 [Candidatus Micrarchaeota archaeon]|nr:hypothetical protein [Candidatus Micrarchaeota archaeon]